MSTTTLYVGWFCPFAQRTWIAAERRGKLVVVNGEESVVLDCEGRYMVKGERLVRATPAGEKPVVPLITWGSSEEREGNRKPVRGSIELCEALFEGDSDFLRGADIARLYSDRLCGSSFYSSLKTTPTSASSFSEWEKSLNEFSSSLVSPFFLGASFTITDAVIFPFLWRARTLHLFESYKNYSYSDACAVEKIDRWISRCLSLPYVRATLPADTNEIGFSKRLYDLYDVYVNGSGLEGVVRKKEDEEVDLSLPEDVRERYKRG